MPGVTQALRIEMDLHGGKGRVEHPPADHPVERVFDPAVLADQGGRLGGDEFVFVLPEMTKGNVAEIQKRLSLAVEEASRCICPGMIVSVSVGCSFYPEDAASGEDLLSEADRDMYEIKEKHYSKAESVS